MYFVFLFLSSQGLIAKVELVQQRKKNNRGKGQITNSWKELGDMQERRKSKVWKNDVLQHFFHCDLVSFPKLFPFLWRSFANATGGVVFILQHFTFLKAPMTCFNWTFYSLFLMLFVKLHPPFLWLFCNFLQFGLAKQGLGFMVSSPMLFIFIFFLQV